MTKDEAVQFLTQMANDFIATLPVSAKNGTAQLAQMAINVLKSDGTKQEPPAGEVKK